MAILPLILFLLISFFSTPSASSVHDTPLTAYQVLEEYDFPVGILPNGVLGYDLNSSTGKFSAYLNGSCTFTIDSYELKYKSTITGKITKDKLENLSGIKVKVLFLWLSISSVTRDDDELEFSVGIASADFPVTCRGDLATEAQDRHRLTLGPSCAAPYATISSTPCTKVALGTWIIGIHNFEVALCIPIGNWYHGLESNMGDTGCFRTVSRWLPVGNLMDTVCF
ncbi:hypothetical protein TIFTF001_007250 [Ficus carica]|uniref:Uncharacterized protein n=1 Tax=Ficus carica TaxID=3494 RepID=A0AA87ZJ37_FICCA|nr:hypothetical protein TIFTF001_007250 [Ficus carica]